MNTDTSDNTIVTSPEVAVPQPAANEHLGSKYIEVSSLTTWDKTDEPTRAYVPEVSSRDIKFPFRKDINQRIALFEGNFENIAVDALICPTNERMDDVGGPHEIIRKRGGDELKRDLVIAGTCRMSECKATPAYNIGSKNIVHTVGPKYNEKYRTAAINSLNKCYLNALQLCVDSGFKTVSFIPIHRTQRQYPVDLGTNIACRTIRRFLEHFPDKVDLIILCCSGAEYHSAYLETLPKYFPRSEAECIATNEVLPDDVGNEWGESFSEERQIRIGALPGMTDEEYDEGGESGSDGEGDDEAPIVVSASGKSQKLALAVKTPNPDRRVAKSRQAEAAAAGEAGNGAQAEVYGKLMDEARERDFSDLERMGFLYHAGRDPQTEQEVVVFLSPKYNNITVSQERFSAYFGKIMDTVAIKKYTLVYLHSTVSERQLQTAWIRAFSSTYPQRYVNNMRLLMVYPTWGLKAFISVVGRFTFLANTDITYVNSLAELYRWLPPKLLRIPLEISQEDPSVAHDLQTTDDLYDNL